MGTMGRSKRTDNESKQAKQMQCTERPFNRFTTAMLPSALGCFACTATHTHTRARHGTRGVRGFPMGTQRKTPDTSQHAHTQWHMRACFATALVGEDSHFLVLDVAFATPHATMGEHTHDKQERTRQAEDEEMRRLGRHREIGGDASRRGTRRTGGLEADLGPRYLADQASALTTKRLPLVHEIA